MIIALLISAAILVAFGLSQAGWLSLGDAPAWLGVIIPIGIMVGIARVPHSQRLSWWLVAAGWVVGVVARELGFEDLSTAGLISFGFSATAHTLWHCREITKTQHPVWRRTVWVLIVTVALMVLILLWPH